MSRSLRVRLVAIAVFWAAVAACSSTPAKLGTQPAVPARWRLASPVMPASTVLDLLITEECSGGMSPEGRIDHAIVEYGANTIWITVPVRPIGKALIECFKADPEFPVRVELAQAVGDRQLENGYGGHGLVDSPATPTPAPLPTAR